jgi:type II secretory pathway pseudopilin PulG
MKIQTQMRKQKGFTFAELLVSSTVFVLMAGAAFSLLGTSSKRFKTDSQVLTSFQEARLGVDQIARDVADSGFPPRNHFSAAPLASLYTAAPFAWQPNYPATLCTVGGSCTTPTAFDLIVETDYDGTGVKWIRYQLPAGTTTLLRAVVPKVAGGDPDASTTGAAILLPYLQNVMNNATAAQITAIRAGYPAMFPGGNPVPLFSYICDVVGSTPAFCAAANTPADIRDVSITIIVQAPNRDSQTQVLRLVELNGVGHRLNPNK